MENRRDQKERLAILWSIGIGTAYAFLIFFIIWMVYRVFLIFTAFQAGEFSFIYTELAGYAIFCVIYFGAGYILRGLKIL